MNEFLKLGNGNAKLNTAIGIFDLPAGHTCPFAKDCLARVNYKTGKLIRGEEAKFRCFAATGELRSPQARNKRKHNLDLIKSKRSVEGMAQLILASMKVDEKIANVDMFRIHTSGDFYSQMYFDAWVEVAKSLPNVRFYAYTKSLKFWVSRINEIPANFHLTASKGGKHDELIDIFNLKNVEVVYSPEEAKLKGLEIDHDDSHCIDPKCTKFALLIHATQPAGSEASKALQALKKRGIGGYKKGRARE